MEYYNDKELYSYLQKNHAEAINLILIHSLTNEEAEGRIVELVGDLGINTKDIDFSGMVIALMES